ncbi:MAG: type 3 dihydrofolate reductase [Halothiobacillaceae bacterium]
MHISLISALAQNNVIGDGNRLPWRLPADLKRFKTLTMGKPIVMGRRTYESIGRLLPGRQTIIISRNPEFRVEGATVVHGLDEALEAAGDAEETMICGGADIYFQFLPRADRMYLTLVHDDVPGDAHFPAFNRREWDTIEEEHHPADADNPHPYSFLTLARRRDD